MYCKFCFMEPGDKSRKIKMEMLLQVAGPYTKRDILKNNFDLPIPDWPYASYCLPIASAPQLPRRIP